MPSSASGAGTGSGATEPSASRLALTAPLDTGQPSDFVIAWAAIDFSSLSCSFIAGVMAELSMVCSKERSMVLVSCGRAFSRATCFPFALATASESSTPPKQLGLGCMRSAEKALISLLPPASHAVQMEMAAPSSPTAAAGTPSRKAYGHEAHECVLMPGPTPQPSLGAAATLALAGGCEKTPVYMASSCTLSYGATGTVGALATRVVGDSTPRCMWVKPSAEPLRSHMSKGRRGPRRGLQ